ncbi:MULTISPECIES: hypothetical protein [Bacillus cereus group]|uniref:hypothetical protein n=1 Tax=Bacillus cereus group TaxID=86661 RepID=UPI000BF50661|nr:hypothetical protein [Bacillus anthracis]PGB56848.1 hypothetical protein COL95_02260 [Bacillus anthracis]
MDYYDTLLKIVNTVIIGGYLVTKAKNFATKQDVKEITKLQELGKNLATKQDIQEITRLQEEIKSKFQLDMEKHKFELTRISKEFELYAIKKHEHYPELYKNISLCIAKIIGLRGFRRVIDFSKLNEADIVKYMEDKSFNDSDKQLILVDLYTNKEMAIKNIELILRRIEYTEAENTYSIANNFYLLHRLFFSSEVSIITEDLLNNIYQLWIYYDPDFIYSNQTKDMINDIKILKENIETIQEELFKQMQKELIKR